MDRTQKRLTNEKALCLYLAVLIIFAFSRKIVHARPPPLFSTCNPIKQKKKKKTKKEILTNEQHNTRDVPS